MMGQEGKLKAAGMPGLDSRVKTSCRQTVSWNDDGCAFADDGQ
jgi:hypothetical protein